MDNITTIQPFLKSKARRYYPKDVQSAMDLVQETNLRMIEKINYYNPQMSLCAWVQTVMRNIYIDYYRKQKKLIYDSEHIENIQEYIDPQHDYIKPFKHTVRGIRNEKIRIALMLRLMGYTYKEISEYTGDSLVCIKKRIYSGKKLIKKIANTKIDMI